MPEHKTLLIGGVGLVKGRIKEAGVIMVEICNTLEPVLKEMRFVETAPFETVHLIIRFGKQTDLEPEFQPLNKRYSELPIAVEVEMAKLRFASREVVRDAFYKATVSALIGVARKYDLPTGSLELDTSK